MRPPSDLALLACRHRPERCARRSRCPTRLHAGVPCPGWRRGVNDGRFGETCRILVGPGSASGDSASRRPAAGRITKIKTVDHQYMWSSWRLLRDDRRRRMTSGRSDGGGRPPAPPLLPSSFPGLDPASPAGWRSQAPPRRPAGHRPPASSALPAAPVAPRPPGAVNLPAAQPVRPGRRPHLAPAVRSIGANYFSLFPPLADLGTSSSPGSASWRPSTSSASCAGLQPGRRGALPDRAAFRPVDRVVRCAEAKGSGWSSSSGTSPS
jgi:hypothetical protein